MSATQAGMYGLVKWLIDHLFSSNISVIVVPFFTLYMLLKFIGWSRATAKGESETALRNDYESLQQGKTLGRSSAPSRKSSYRRRG